MSQPPPPPKPVTVIAAVWCGQADKEALLRGHMANLDRQTTPHERIYVFDGGDQPPDWLTGTAVGVREPLTLYQAWNVALSLVQTPFVMNLNLDDRLAVDAMEVMLARIEESPDNFLVGGDWKICSTAEETDDVGRCYPISELPQTQAWPPVPGVTARIGSGDGLYTWTLGPGCLWRMAAHLTIPRYPYRFLDGTLIRIVGDGVWWQLIQGHLNKLTVRTPMVVGNYRSWPANQAEFRYNADHEVQNTLFSLL
jgi:hypothetical protein